MNERIKEFEDQASQYASRETTDLDEWEFIFRKKFAEMIVKECAKVAWYHTPDTEELEYSHLIEDKILKHFGVK
jgi:hypothetical protein